MQFTKMHGAGNDYIYVNCFEVPPPKDPVRLAADISHRNFGAGADGLVLILPHDGGDADARMRMFNADGSEAEMCGNALRCVAWLLRDREEIPDAESPRVLTGRGVLRTEVLESTPRGGRVRVEMGHPRLAADEIPTTLEGTPATGTVFAAERDWGVTCVSMGNPHAVIFCEEPSAAVRAAGPVIERLSVFPERTNVEFVEAVEADRLRVRVWERGSGETLACGTGACAAVVAGSLQGRCGRTAVVELPGGELEVDWREEGGVWLTGPVAEVYRGRWLG